jgi:hypothetical protein
LTRNCRRTALLVNPVLDMDLDLKPIDTSAGG